MAEINVAYFGGPETTKLLSNFAHTPFVVDDEEYASVEGFWQSLKTEDDIMRRKIATMTDPLDTRQLGRRVARGASIFTYKTHMYVVGSQAHHMLLERAIRAKTQQNEDVRLQFVGSHPQTLKHRTKNKFGQWRPGDSPSLPAVVFEGILTRIRDEVMSGAGVSQLPQPDGISVVFAD